MFPILLAAPHAGRDYPVDILQKLRISADQLLRLEDRYVDVLIRENAERDIPTIFARTPRAIIDLNRSEDEIDADMVRDMNWSDVAHPTAKTRGGLGLIPRRLAGAGDIWKHPIIRDDLDDRIMNLHRPYHEYVAAVLHKMRAKFGFALLIDMHSMPPLQNPMANGNIAQWVVGDRFGMSADNIYSDIITEFFKNLGYDVALNSPYAGGYILERHGIPSKGYHAVQIEIDRQLYLDENYREPNENAKLIAAQIAQLVEHMIQYFDNNQSLEAAE